MVLGGTKMTSGDWFKTDYVIMLYGKNIGERVQHQKVILRAQF